MKDGSTIGPDSRLYLGNLHPSITDSDLKLLLSQFGPIDYVNLHRDELGNSKGFAFTRYARAEDAANAMLRLQVKTFSFGATYFTISYLRIYADFSECSIIMRFYRNLVQ